MDKQISVNDEQEYEITFEDVKNLLDKRYTLFYADYRDNLDNNMEEIQEAIQKQEWFPIDESIDDWIFDNQQCSVDYIYQELAENIAREYDIPLVDAKDVLDNYWHDGILDIIYDRDDSEPIKDLLRNTEEPVMFYDIGEEIEYSWGDELAPAIKQVKKILKIKLSETKWDNKISMMLQQGDCGRLVVYFRANVNQMMDLRDKNIVIFKNPHIALINTWNGSGDDTQLDGHEFTIPFNIENFFIDKTIKYNYTYEVCGMSSNWCEDTDIRFGTKKIKSPKNSGLKSSLHREQEIEAMYNKTFKEGKCTSGDMDMRRHRNTYYLNEYPCGTHCPHCGNFWID